MGFFLKNKKKKPNIHKILTSIIHY